jgi:glycosyltransferase involved in cell wall biosynthesis
MGFLETLNIPFEIIIGSNGSTDRTCQLAKNLCDLYQNLSFYHLSQKGVGSAFREMVKMAKYDRIITVDMDLSVSLEFIPEAYRLLVHHDIVIGSKITGRQKRSWIRKTASNLFIGLAKILLKLDFHDYSIAAKGYRTEVVKSYLPHIDNKTFYVVKIVYRAYYDDKCLKEIPVQCDDMRGSRFNLIHEGVYKFANLFRLWFSFLLKH